jgi:hypothetical protein
MTKIENQETRAAHRFRKAVITCILTNNPQAVQPPDHPWYSTNISFFVRRRIRLFQSWSNAYDSRQKGIDAS